MPHILAVASEAPPDRIPQTSIKREFGRLCAGIPHVERLMPVFDRSGVEVRHLIHQPVWYLEPRTFDERNREYQRCALDLAEAAARRALVEADVAADQIDHIYFVSTTGLATPSLDALLAERLGLRPTVRRNPLFGLGCAAGAGALARAGDVLTGRARDYALVVSVEICSLVFSKEAKTPTDLIGVALFGDGAAAAVLAGDETGRTGARIKASETHLFADAKRLMGWDFTCDGMRLVLARDIPEVVHARIAPVVSEFVERNGAQVNQLTHHVMHPGGPKVMATYRTSFGLADEALQVARNCMREYGNLSSAAVLFMLSDVMANRKPQPGDSGIVLALGPGFGAEMLLLEW
jgi:alkylresorcinol/alkylpyrone synthase